jgi:glutamate-1-semialdehyde 2,1-aminomutase
VKVLALVQARMGSARLPNKVMREVGGIPLIELLLTRLSQSKTINQIVVATSIDAKNLPLVNHVSSLGYQSFQGSEQDVLERFYFAAQQFVGDIIIRITGDCPLIDPQLVDEAIQKFQESGVDYLCNANPPTFPDGLDIEVFSFSSLERAYYEANAPSDREHVTPYIRESGHFSTVNVASEADFSNLRWTVDEDQDLEVVRFVVEHFAPNRLFSWKDVLQMYESHSAELTRNSAIVRNEGNVLKP